MPIQSLENPVFISVDGAGRANAGGTVGVYVAGTSFATKATIYSDQVKTTEIANPVTMNDAGVGEIWFDVKVDIQEKTAADVLVRDTLNIDPNAAASVATGFNLAENGSFETDSDSNGQPDSWTISPYSGSAIAISSTVVTDGTKSLEFNTGAAGGGGGTATGNKFAVTEGSVVSVNWSFYATHATTLNTFQIKWYDHLDVLQSTSTVTMPASGSVPTSWTEYTDEVTVDAAGTQGEIVLTGISSGGANLSSKAYFDGIKVTNLTNMATLAGVQVLASKNFTDSNDNEVLNLGETASAVNEITITNAATGNRPTISTSGEADIGIDFENDQGEELLELVAVPTAVNNVRVTNAATGNNPILTPAGEADTDIDLARTGGTASLSTMTLSTSQATTSGTEVDFTSIPSWVKKVTMTFNEISSNGTAGFDILIGDSGGIETTGYLGASSTISTVVVSATLSAGFTIIDSAVAGVLFSGTATLTLQDSSVNRWCFSSIVGASTATPTTYICGGSKPLSAVLDRVRINARTDTFDAGSVNILYEG